MDDAQEKPRPEPPREVAPRDDVHVAGSPVRCPFCHTDVAIDGEWSACARCLARHHQPCWSEGGRCGSCGHDAAVRHGADRRLLGGAAVAVVVIFSAALAIMLVSFAGQVLQHFRRGHVVPAAAPPPPVEPAPRPAARYEKDGALVVEDGRGNFVVVIEAEDAVVFGLNMTVNDDDLRGLVLRRPLLPLTVYSGDSMSRSDLPRPGLTTAEVTEVLRRVRPPELDVEYLLRRARGD